MEKYIFRVRRKLESDEITPAKILKYLHQLGKLPVTFSVLKETSIGKVVNGLKKHEDKEIQEKAKQLVLEWKHQLSQEKQQKNEAEETYEVPDYSSTHGNADAIHYQPTVDNADMSKTAHYIPSTLNEYSKSDSPKKKDLSSPYKHAKSHTKDVKNKHRPCLMSNKSNNLSKKSYSSFDFLSTPQSKADEDDVVDDDNDGEEQGADKVLQTTGRKTVMPTLPDIQLPEVVPVYRPMYRCSEGETDSDSPKKKKKAIVNEIENMASNFVSRKSRTQVFSGKRYGQSGGVPSLYHQCMRVLTENIDALHDTGGVPFDILEPLLVKCTPNQLSYLEECNPYFLEDTENLWKTHCHREFKNCTPGIDKTWKELYRDKLYEREEKLKRINERITQSQAKKVPVRQAKLAYVTTTPKAPFQGRRPKSKYTIDEPKALGQSKSSGSHSSDRKRTHSSAEKMTVDYVGDVAVPCPVPRRDTAAPKKSAPPPKKSAAKPMMQAALKMMKKQKARMASGVIRR